MAELHGLKKWVIPTVYVLSGGNHAPSGGPFLSRFRRPFSNQTQRRETAENHLKASECLKIFSEDIEQTRSKNNTSMYG